MSKTSPFVFLIDSVAKIRKKRVSLQIIKLASGAKLFNIFEDNL